MTTRAAPLSRVITTAAPKTAPQPATPQPLPLIHQLQRTLGNRNVGALIQRCSSGHT